MKCYKGRFKPSIDVSLTLQNSLLRLHTPKEVVVQRTPVQLHKTSQLIKHKGKKKRLNKLSTITQLAVAKQQVNDISTTTQNRSYEYYHGDDKLLRDKDDDDAINNNKHSQVEEIGPEKGT